jgi:NTE family protein
MARVIFKDRVPPSNPVCISSYEVKGTDQTRRNFSAHHELRVKSDVHCQAVESNGEEGIRHPLLIGYLFPGPLRMELPKSYLRYRKSPPFAKLGLHYNRFTGIGVIANITSRNFSSRIPEAS